MIKRNDMMQYEWEQEMSVKILEYVRSEIYIDLRFMDVALSALEWQADDTISTFATDGNVMRYSTEQLLRVFRSNPKFLDRAYLHVIFHCIYAHLWIAGDRNRDLWNLSCDIAVEYTIDMLDKPCTARALSYVRQRTYEELSALGGISAAGVYKYIEQMDGDSLNILQKEFYTDSHKYWPKEEKKSASKNEAEEKWDKVRRQTDMQMERRGSETEKGEQSLIQQLKVRKSKRSYREFLRKFAVLKEEMHCDPDEFDMNYYTYGLSVYGNMPLIEPLESREVMKINEFVIVVDTSYSTSGELIRKFLKETFTILSEQNSFFRKCTIRIIQCDDKVQMDETVTDISELDALLERFTIVGGGGTDFRPAFAYVNELRENGELTRLKGLLYFTDGKGIYPAKRPSYDTAFIFVDDYDEQSVPAWAIRMKLDGLE